MLFCTRCGREADEGVSLCTSCGARVEIGPTREGSEPPTKIDMPKYEYKTITLAQK
jgi:uncharacterized membrane protein YvbJ